MTENALPPELASIREFPEHFPFQTQGPWDRPRTRYFYQGQLSSFAKLDRPITLPAGYHGHPPGETCQARIREAYFAACKACDQRTFQVILDAGSGAEAKRLGGRGGIIPQIRPDWDEVSYAVMLTFCRVQFRLPGWREMLLSTGDWTLVERSRRHDTRWGGYDQTTDRYDGLNLLGICLMHTREELRHELHGQGFNPQLSTFGADT